MWGTAPRSKPSSSSSGQWPSTACRCCIKCPQLCRCLMSSYYSTVCSCSSRCRYCWRRRWLPSICGGITVWQLGSWWGSPLLIIRGWDYWAISSVLLFSHFFRMIKTLDSFSISVPISQVLPQLSCSGMCHIWMWFVEFNMWFCVIINFHNRKSNEWSFSNPRPRMQSDSENSTLSI